MVKQTLQSESGSHAENGLYKEMVHILDRELILALRQELGNNHSKIAKQLGISRTTLLQKIKTLDM
jgi:transcriptional regulator with PAS, ATPase and Fis domain